jgi:hypothetical protein
VKSSRTDYLFQIYARLKQRASFALLAAQEFDEARRLMIESELDPREVYTLQYCFGQIDQHFS